jgi:hypothetical protein
MPGLVPGIHALLPFLCDKTWMAGTSPAMTAHSQQQKFVRAELADISQLELPVAGKRQGSPDC